MFEVFLGLGYVGIFLLALLLNILPFTSPSNMVVAGAAAALIPSANPLVLGLAVAMASSMAKMVHFYTAYYAGGSLSEERKRRLQGYGRRIERWGVLAAFVAAVSPLPDDPVVVPLGLMRYNPAKFLLGFFCGKIIVTTAGAYIGQTAALTLETYLGNTAIIIISIGLTLAIAILLLYRGGKEPEEASRRR